jgi:tetratricopeptide (TPR) repeat protein
VNISDISVRSVSGKSFDILYKQEDLSAEENKFLKSDGIVNTGVFISWYIAGRDTCLKSIRPSNRNNGPRGARGDNNADSGEAAPSKFEKEQRDKETQILELFVKAFGFYNNADYDKSVQFCQTILVLNPQYKKAKDLLADATKKIKQKVAEAHLNKAISVATEGKAIEAASEWQQALSSSPDDPQIASTIKKLKEDQVNNHLQKASDLFKKDNLIEAISEWNIILAIEPDNSSAKKGIQDANTKLNNIGKTERIKMEYENYIERAKAANEEKNYNSAIEQYNLALKVKPDDLFARGEVKRITNMVDSIKKTSLSSALRFADAKDWVNMSKEARNCLSIEPNNQDAINLLTKYRNERYELRDKLYLEGLDAYSNDDLDTAIAKWKDVLALDPNYEKATLNINKAIRKKQKP